MGQIPVCLGNIQHSSVYVKKRVMNCNYKAVYYGEPQSLNTSTISTDALADTRSIDHKDKYKLFVSYSTLVPKFSHGRLLSL